MDTFWVYASVRDEERLMPYFLRHYMDYADKVVVQDCGSSDRTVEIVKEFGAELIQTEPWGMDELRRRNESMQFVMDNKDNTRWCACVDADEFLIGDFDWAFDEADANQCDVLMTIGWSMGCNGLPKYDGRQIYDVCESGWLGGAEKPCIARAGLNFEWSSGRHFVESKGTRILCSRISLLHYRYLGHEYTTARNSKNWQNSPDKGTAWCVAPDRKGYGSPQWAEETMAQSKPIMDDVLMASSADNPSRWHNDIAVMTI